ncbi:alpha/beta fold hydrolase [Rhodococcus sp. HM1]|uniref:alpha/beta fold hydrolase n=1 Tax=unclassified Rhodococcus (in: high G+C Gram-positive bacteria) TaxID=192944 RepID=UPI0018CE062D|nr:MULTISPECIES: alpha/beta hydrolase [unclassified Rhodococcus (in: high G+C Gram-positive bacteria)]MBH0119756.1 alpha/beta fold hydrolase [Rhodococcus sp. CX]MCK8674948.1 alpha/beta fold hydrolase [Rhodococcus sp. HM1]
MTPFTEEATSKVVDTPSGQVHYHEYGEGRPVVFLHGSGPGATGWSNFSANMKALGSQFRCLAVDMPGWGRSAAVTPAERCHHRTAVEFLDALQIESAAFIGNSMGGATCLKVAATAPERVTHIVTMGAGAGGSKLFGPADGPTEGLKVLQQAYRDPSPESMRALVDVMTYDPAFASDALAEERSRNAKSVPHHLENFITGIGKDRPHRATDAELASISVPALIIHGRDDRVVHFENGLKLCTLIPDSRLLLLNRCGHWAQLEHAEEFNRSVAGFLAA